LLNALAELKEEDPTTLDHLGDVYEKLGAMKEAVQYWERALKLEPEEPEKVREKIDAGKKKVGT
jgi:Flp pilus assembly protein TadD